MKNSCGCRGGECVDCLRAENEAMRRLLGKLLPGDEDKNRDALLEERRNVLAAR